MKARRKEITVTRKEIEMIEDFFEACDRLEVAEVNTLGFLEAIADEDEEYLGIDIVIKEQAESLFFFLHKRLDK